MNRGHTIDEVAKRAGVGRESLYRMRQGSTMGFTNLDAALRAMGLKLKIVEITDDDEV